jgi:hypothetical protein
MTATVTISILAFVVSLFATMMVGYGLAAHDKRAARPDEWHVDVEARAIVVQRRIRRGGTNYAAEYDIAARLTFDPEDDDARAAALARAEAVLFAVRDTQRRLSRTRASRSQARPFTRCTTGSVSYATTRA